MDVRKNNLSIIILVQRVEGELRAARIALLNMEALQVET